MAEELKTKADGSASKRPKRPGLALGHWLSTRYGGMSMAKFPLPKIWKGSVLKAQRTRGWLTPFISWSWRR